MTRPSLHAQVRQLTRHLPPSPGTSSLRPNTPNRRAEDADAGPAGRPGPWQRPRARHRGQEAAQGGGGLGALCRASIQSRAAVTGHCDDMDDLREARRALCGVNGQAGPGRKQCVWYVYCKLFRSP